MSKKTYISGVEEKQSETIINLVKVQSLIDAHLQYTGRESGESYEWLRAGDIQNVDERDVPELLSKRIGERSCCGEGGLGNLVFQEII